MTNNQKKLVVAVSSRALFDLEKENDIFEKDGIKAYRDYQIKNVDKPLKPGVAFAFIRRLLSLNDYFPNSDEPFQVIVLSRNNPETGERFFKSCKYYNLPIRGGAFTSGHSTYRFLKAYGACLFLTANKESVINATGKGYPAGLVLPTLAKDDPNDVGLRIAFDFDGVLIDDESEKAYIKSGLEGFRDYEQENVNLPHADGPLLELFRKLAHFQHIDLEINGKDNPNYEPIIRISIVTARGAPSEERLITTLKSWGMDAAELFLMNGLPKQGILEELKPHIFFDDQLHHLSRSAESIPSVLIPFGVTREKAVNALKKTINYDFK